jgi:hypothetical protein
MMNAESGIEFIIQHSPFRILISALGGVRTRISALRGRPPGRLARREHFDTQAPTDGFEPPVTRVTTAGSTG